MKEFLKKLNNYRLFSMLLAISGALTVIIMAIGLALYQTSTKGISPDTGAEIFVTAFSSNQVAGMVYFIEAIVGIVLGVVVIYKLFPYLFPKQKLNPTRVYSYVDLASGVFCLAFAIQMIYLVSSESTNNFAGFIILIIFSILNALYSGCLIYPTLKCNFYCPEPKKK